MERNILLEKGSGTNKAAIRIVSFLSVFVILCNLLIWVEINPLIKSAVSYLILMILFFNRGWVNLSNNWGIICLVGVTVLISIQMLFLDGITSMIANIVGYLIGIYLFCLKDNLKEYLLLFVTNVFGYILLISIVSYVIYLVHPISPIRVLDHPYGYDNHDCYISFILPSFRLIPRFSGPFIEPGHIAMFSTFILYANRFQFKENKILYSFLITILISFSLAGYLLLIMAWFFYKRIKLKTFLIGVFILLGAFLIVTKVWNNGDNPVNDLIILRLQYDDESGISGNNRDLYYTDNYFKKANEDGKLISGIGLNKYMDLSSSKIIGGAGYKIFLIQYGYIGLLLVFCYYWIIAYNFKRNIYSLSFLCLLAICFIQRAYPYWLAWLIPFITSFNKHNFNQKILNNKE